MSRPRLEIESLSVSRRGREIVREISFAAGVGEILGLLGPNGAGKSTTFRVLAGLLSPKAGSLRLDGKTLPFGDREFRRRAGVVFQDAALDKRLTARENLTLAARLQSVPRTVASERVATALTRSGLADRADDRVDRFSGGMKRRLDLERALLHDPEILLLDEPTSGLDEAAFRRTWTTLSDLRATRQMTIVLTTHRPEEAERCDRLAILDGGRLVAVDTPDHLRQRVRGDVLTIVAERPEAAAATLAERFQLQARHADGQLVVEVERAHERIPAIVEALAESGLRSLAMRPTGLAEVFLALTGHDLAGESRNGSEKK